MCLLQNEALLLVGFVGASSDCCVPEQAQLAGSAPSFDRFWWLFANSQSQQHHPPPLHCWTSPDSSSDAVQVGLITLSHCCLVFCKMYLFFVESGGLIRLYHTKLQK